MNIYVKYTLFLGTEEYEVCVKNCPVKLDMYFGVWFTGHVALGAQIIEIVIL